MTILLSGALWGLAALAVAWGLAVGAWLTRIIMQEQGRDRVPCLLYHQFQPAHRREAAASVDPVYVCFADRFEEQMVFLKSGGYTTLHLDELLEARAGRTRLPAKPVIVTFDDGFGSNYELAFPVLRRNGQKATIFMTPDRTSENFRMFAHLDRPLTDRELREMTVQGIDIQSHGLTHRYLVDLDDHDLTRDLCEPRRLLEEVTGRPIRYLAIPGGAYDRRVRRAARQAGYEAVFCMRKGSASPHGDLFALPRMVVSRDMSLADFRALLTPEGWIRGRIISTAQEALSRALGMRRTDALRDRLYASPLAPLLRPRIIPWIVLGGVAILGALLLGTLSLLGP